MKTKIILMLFALSLSTISSAQMIYNPLTGDSEMDAVLKDINKSAISNIAFFENDVISKFSIAKASIDKVIKILPPGDIFMLAQIAFLTGKPFDLVIKTYNVHKDKGWGAIAKEMGIRPGSPEFHNMKKALKSNGNKNKAGMNPGSNGPKDPGNGNGNNHGNGNKNSGGGQGKKK